MMDWMNWMDWTAPDCEAAEFNFVFIILALRSLRLEDLETVLFHQPDRLNGISCWTSFVNLHHYRSLKLN